MAVLSLEHQAILKKYNEEIKAKNLTRLWEMKNLLRTMFTEENHQISVITVFRDADNSVPVNRYMETLKSRAREIHYTFTLYFPEFTIANGGRGVSAKSHVIKDLYVQFFMNGDLKLTSGDFGYLGGLRTTYTPQEWEADYAHSHLPGRATKFERFCTGSGPINQVIQRLTRGYASLDFHGFLLNIKSYVIYESLEGTPHRYIKNIGISNSVGLHPITLTPLQIKKLLALHFQLFLTEYKLLTYSVDEYKVDVTLSDEFNIKFAEVLRTNFQLSEYREIFDSYTLNQITPLRLSNGQYSTASPAATIPNYSPSNLIEFKKQQKQLYIGYGTDSATGTTNVRYTHPTIAELLIKEFSRLLTTTAIKVQNPGW